MCIEILTDKVIRPGGLVKRQTTARCSLTGEGIKAIADLASTGIRP
jgi:hypothetical protein